MKKIIRLVENFKELNSFRCFYFQKSSDEIGIKFENPTQCALMFALFKSMLIQNIVVTLKDDSVIEVLDFSKYCNA